MTEAVLLKAHRQWADAYIEFLGRIRGARSELRQLGLIDHPVLKGRFIMDAGHAICGVLPNYWR